MKKTHSSLVSAIIASFVLLTGESVRAAELSLSIDTFSQGTQSVQVGRGSNTPFSEVGDFPNSIIGGYRDLFLTNISGTTNQRSVAAGVDLPDFETLFYSNDTNVVSRLEVVWDGLDNSSNVLRDGLGGINLSRDGKLDALVLSFLSADLSLNTTVRVWDMNNKFSTASFRFNQSIANEEVNFVYDADDFNGITGNKALFTGTADFTNVGAIQLLLRGQPSTLADLDAEIDIVESVDLVAEVPEPSLAIGLGVFMLGALGIKMSGKK